VSRAKKPPRQQPASVSSRSTAACALARVFEHGQSLDKALSLVLPRLDQPRDRALCQQLCYGVLRWHLRLEALSKLLLKKPLKKKEHEVRCLIMIGLYQLVYMRTATHASVAETVNAARALKKDWAAGLINALLRRFQRETDALSAQADQSLQAKTAHPEWLLKRFQQDWPDDWQAITDANNQQAPMTLRVNSLQSDVANYRTLLADKDIAAQPCAHTEYGLTLDTPQAVTALPGFGQGLCSVQDGAAQMAAELLQPQPGQIILDACAAPGGKSCALLEREPAIAQLTALDNDGERMQRIQDNLERLMLGAELQQGSALEPDAWWDGKPFDQILLDAPCSGSGVIRRHPDIKLLRRDQDIAPLSQQQTAMLAAMWPLLRPGGRLLYSTCSVLRQENEKPVAALLEKNPDAQEIVLDSSWGVACTHGRQILPGSDGKDGFYYALIQKQT